MLGVPFAHRAIEPVGADHQVGIGVRGGISHLGPDLDAHAQLLAATSQHAQQRLPRQTAEAVAARGDHEAAVVDVDIVPVREVAGHRVVRVGIGSREVVLRRVGKNDAEPKCVLEPIALEDRDVVLGMGLLHQDAEVQRRGPAADRDDPHLMSCPAMMSC